MDWSSSYGEDEHSNQSQSVKTFASQQVETRLHWVTSLLLEDYKSGMNLLHQPHLTAVILLIWSGDIARFDYRLANPILNIWRSQSILWPELNSTENLVNEFATFVFFTIFKFGEVNFYIKDKFTCRWQDSISLGALFFYQRNVRWKSKFARIIFLQLSVIWYKYPALVNGWTPGNVIFFFSFFFFHIYIYLFSLNLFSVNLTSFSLLFRTETLYIETLVNF